MSRKREGGRRAAAWRLFLELRPVAALGQRDADEIIAALSGVVGGQQLAESTGLHPDRGIVLRVEALRPTQRIDRNIVSFELFAAPGQFFLNNMPQKLLKLRS